MITHVSRFFTAAVVVAACRSGAGDLTAPARPDGEHASKDCPDCPAMTAIPGGSFTMGSPATEPERYRLEGPQRRLAVTAFAIGVTEVTRREYAAFVADTRRPERGGCLAIGDGTIGTGIADPQASWRHPGFDQTDDHPAVCMSWQDATDYAAWLARKTGRAYRLPSEAEWEYAARSGTTTPFYWGDSADAGCAYMNGGDASLARAVPIWPETIRKAGEGGEQGARLVGCDDGAGFTAAVGRYLPNRFGLYDMIGNVWEFVADCYEEALPVEARAYLQPGCTEHRARGGSWDDYPRDLRAARRSRITVDYRGGWLGFRVARSPAP
jgi:sulfatase modifying factor 1